MRAKKSYGQHFLIRPDISRRIAQSLEHTSAYDHLLEVGPGKGMLTQFLMEQSFDLKVVEADEDMVLYLSNTYPTLNKAIISGDFLKMPLEQLFDGNQFALIGNFPYNISSQILFKMLDYRDLIPEMVGMFQKEVAERVIAGPGSKTYGVTSVLVQAFYEGKYLFKVDKSSFSPPPKVQSAVIRLTRKDNQDLGCDYKLLRRVVKTAFSQRRKMLRNTMKMIIGKHPLLEGDFFKKRPEVLSLYEFVDLTNIIEANMENA